MSYKIMVLAPSAGGKSTLMRYMRENTSLSILEMDEEVLKAYDNVWPTDNTYKDEVLVPQIVDKILKMDEVIYLASYVPEEQITIARNKGFKIILLSLTLQQLQSRNTTRVEIESYDDATPWLQLQLDDFEQIKKKGLIDLVVDGNKTTAEIAEEVSSIANKQ